MSEKERMSRANILFYAAIAAVLIFSFVLFVPKVASTLFPLKRTAIWNSFISDTKELNRIDPQKYWEFREFYSPGYFTINKSATPSEINSVANKFEILSNNSFSTLLIFNSKNLTSMDTLTSENDFLKILGNIPKNNIIFQNTNSIIYKTDIHHAVISFILPLGEMEKSNGFFDYREKDKDLVKGKQWYNITHVTLP